MQFERIKKNHKRKIIIGGLILVCVISAITITTTRAKYKLTEDIPLVRGTINYKVPDLRIVAVSISEDGTNYNIVDEIPTSGYNFNSEKSVCKVATETSGIENAPKDNNITIEYVNSKINILGVTKKGTRCYLYFDKILDSTKPTITNVATSVTKTEINVTVSATDNEGVTEYWYQLNSNTPVKGTGNTYKFTGLSAGTTYSVKVYVKDAAGNQSDTTTKSVQTIPNNQTIDSILAGLTVKTGTPTFSNIATTDEGVYKVSDGMYGGYSYYWRGATTNNYVKFSNKCWRIVRINGDKTMRLIYDGATCHANGTKTAESVVMGSTNAERHYSTNDGKTNNSSYVGWTYSLGSQRTTGGTASNAKTQTEKWYNANITGTNANKVADGKFCNDRNVGKNPDGVQGTWRATGAEFYYAGYYRLLNDYTPTLSCNSNDVYTLKVGAITADEVEFAGGKKADNTSYYLYNGQNYWTMSPSNWTDSAVGVFHVGSSGNFDSWNVGSTNGLRPVINLRSDTQFQGGGNGTLNNPYVVE